MERGRSADGTKARFGDGEHAPKVVLGNGATLTERGEPAPSGPSRLEVGSAETKRSGAVGETSLGATGDGLAPVILGSTNSGAVRK